MVITSKSEKSLFISEMQVKMWCFVEKYGNTGFILSLLSNTKFVRIAVIIYKVRNKNAHISSKNEKASEKKNANFERFIKNLATPSMNFFLQKFDLNKKKKVFLAIP